MMKNVYDVLLDEVFTITKGAWIEDEILQKIEDDFIKRNRGHFLIDTDSVAEMTLLHDIIRKHFGMKYNLI